MRLLSVVVILFSLQGSFGLLEACLVLLKNSVVSRYLLVCLLAVVVAKIILGIRTVCSCCVA